jgi:hypothetical protein
MSENLLQPGMSLAEILDIGVRGELFRITEVEERPTEANPRAGNLYGVTTTDPSLNWRLENSTAVGIGLKELPFSAGALAIRCGPESVFVLSDPKAS